MNEKRIRAVVEGYVQGVGFRWFVSRAARRLGISGWVRNNPDGSVETVAEGEESKLDEFVDRLRQGPSSASVSDVTITEEKSGKPLTDFRIVR